MKLLVRQDVTCSWTPTCPMEGVEPHAANQHLRPWRRRRGARPAPAAARAFCGLQRRALRRCAHGPASVSKRSLRRRKGPGRPPALSRPRRLTFEYGAWSDKTSMLVDARRRARVRWKALSPARRPPLRAVQRAPCPGPASRPSSRRRRTRWVDGTRSGSDSPALSVASRLRAGSSDPSSRPLRRPDASAQGSSTD